MTHKFTHEEWVATVSPDVWDHYETSTEYQGSKKPISFRCKTCGAIITGSANYMRTLKPHPCKYLLPSDVEEKARDHQLPKTVSEAITFYIGDSPDNVDILTNGIFRGVGMVLQAHCHKHNKRFKTSIKNMMRGKCDCKECTLELFQYIRTLLKERYKELGVTQVFTLHNRGEYTSLESLRFRHNKCGHTFKDSLQHLLEHPLEDNCPHCSEVTQGEQDILKRLTIPT